MPGKRQAPDVPHWAALTAPCADASGLGCVASVVDLQAARAEDRLADVLVTEDDLTDETALLVEMAHQRVRACLAAACATRRRVIAAPEFDFHCPRYGQGALCFQRPAAGRTTIGRPAAHQSGNLRSKTRAMPVYAAFLSKR